MAFERPKLSDPEIVRKLASAYDLEVAELTFLPIGNDSASWSYRVNGRDGTCYFLKVRAFDRAMPGAEVPHFLTRQGVSSVLAPLPPKGGAPWARAGSFALILFPFLDGISSAVARLGSDQWRQLGATVRAIHGTVVTAELEGMVRAEEFVPGRRELFPAIEEALDGPRDGVGQSFAADWSRHRDVIHRLVERADDLGRKLRGCSLPNILCHADLHTWNVVVTGGRAPLIVDWDEASLAPKERDLMFVIGGISADLVKPRDTQDFLRGYGPTDVDDLALVYYRCAWAVQDICAYGETVMLRPNDGEQTRIAALRGFGALFDVGAIVDIATKGPQVRRGG